MDEDCQAVTNLRGGESEVSGITLFCWLPPGHDGPHWDDVDRIYWLRDDPPEYEPDGDDEAERIAEQFDEARAELDRGELA